MITTQTAADLEEALRFRKKSIEDGNAIRRKIARVCMRIRAKAYVRTMRADLNPSPELGVVGLKEAMIHANGLHT